MATNARLPPSALLGRQSECEQLARLVASVKAGQSRVLVVRGEAGVGKTALLEYLLGRASACRIVRAAGVESQMELAFAGLHQLCAPMLGGLDGLPGPQQDALRVAFGLQEGADSRSLLRRAGGAEPPGRGGRGATAGVPDRRCAMARSRVRAGALVRGAAPARRADRDGVRRPRAEPRGWVRRSAGAGRPRDSGTTTRVRCSRRRCPGVLDERIRDRIVAETRGNPLALIELPRGLTPAELAGGFGLPDAGPLSGQIEQSFLRRFEALPPGRSGCCSPRRPSRSATSPCCGARPSDSGSGPTPSRRLRRQS